MKTLVGMLLTIGLAVGYSEADAQTCKSKQMAHKTKAKSEQLAMHKSKHSSGLATRCVCRGTGKSSMASSKTGVINARSYGGYKKTPAAGGSMTPASSDTMNRNLNNGTLNNGGSIDTMQNREQLNPSDTTRFRDRQLDRNEGTDQNDKPIINNGWENSGMDYQNK